MLSLRESNEAFEDFENNEFLSPFTLHWVHSLDQVRLLYIRYIYQKCLTSIKLIFFIRFEGMQTLLCKRVFSTERILRSLYWTQFSSLNVVFNSSWIVLPFKPTLNQLPFIQVKTDSLTSRQTLMDLSLDELPVDSWTKTLQSQDHLKTQLTSKSFKLGSLPTVETEALERFYLDLCRLIYTLSEGDPDLLFIIQTVNPHVIKDCYFWLLFRLKNCWKMDIL